MKTKLQKLVKHEPAMAYAMTVGGPGQYVSTVVRTFFGAADGKLTKREVEAECTQPYHSVVCAVVLTLADYRRLLRAAAK